MHNKPHSKEAREKMRLAKLGRHLSEEHRNKIGLSVSGKLNGFYGRKHTLESIEKMKESHNKNKRLEVKHHNWKGDNVGYRSLHQWIRSRLIQPELCEICNIKQSKHLANVTGIYNRDLENWKYLCVSCHKLFDLSRSISPHT